MSRYNRSPGTALALPFPEPNLASIPEAAAPQGMSITQLWAVVVAYWKLIAIMAITIIVLGAVAIKLLPKTYTATATLIVNSDVKDPLAGRDFPVELIGNYVSTQIELMTSPIVLLPVIQRLDLVDDKDFTAGSSGSADAVREVVQKNLAAAIQIERGIGGQLLYVSVSSRIAAKAAEIANAVADVYMEQDRRRLNDPAGERAQRYSEELAELRAKATLAQDKVTAFRKENSIGDMNSASTGTEVQTLDTLHQRLLETQNARRALEAKLAEQRRPSDVAPGSTVLDAQLAELAQASSTYGPQHPKVKELNAQIAMTRQSLANANHGVSSATEIELAGTRDLERKYAQAVTDQEARVLKFREAQDEGSKLVLELESAKSVYKQALDGFDQIMFQAVASHTNVSVVSRAVAPLHSSKPNKTKLMLGVVVFGLGLGVGLPLVYGLFFARRLRCRDDIERDFGIAVLAQLQTVPTLMGAK